MQLFQFRIKLKDEDGYFPASAFARSEAQAKELLQDRFSQRIENFAPKRATK